VLALASASLTTPALATQTATPTLYTPAASSSSAAQLRVHYSLPEAAATGTVVLTLEGERTFEIRPIAADAAVGDHELTINVAAPSSSPAVSSASPTGAIPDGEYKFKLSYEGKTATGVASVTHEHLSIITKTATPTLIAPAAQSEIGEEFTVEYSLPEEAAPGSVQLAFKAPGGAESLIALPATAKGTHTAKLNPFDFAVGGSLVSGPEALSAGEYSLTVSYQDSLLNASTASAPTTFTFAHPSPSPSLLAPAAESSSDTPLLVRYDLPEAAASATLTFEPAVSAEGTETDQLQLASAALTAGEHEFSLNVHSLTALSSIVTSATHTSLVDGVYGVKLEYKGVLATAPASVTNGTVTIRTATHTPILYQPANESTVNEYLPIQFVLPETGAAGTVKLTLTPESGTPSVIAFTSGSTPRSTLGINLLNLRGSVEAYGTLLSGPNALAGGKYTASISFQDQSLDPTAYSQSHAFTYDRATAAPTLLSPSESSSSSTPLLIHYDLPEAAKTGSLKLTFEGTEATVHVTLAAAVSGAGEHEFSLNLHSLVASSTTVASASPSAVPDGTYKVKLEYEGESATSPTSVSVTGLVLDTATQTPSVLAPANEASIGGEFTVEYSLPERASLGTVNLALTRSGGSTSTLQLPSAAAGTHAVTLNPVNLAAGGVLLSGPSALSGGEYSVVVSYQDALGNNAATSTVRKFTFAHPTETPILSAPLASSRSSSQLHLHYDLPEAAVAGSLHLKFEHSQSSEGTPIEMVLGNAVAASGEHEVTLDTESLVGSGSVVVTASPDAIPDGSYTVALSYQGANATASASTTVHEVVIDSSTSPPAILAPAANAVVGEDLSVEFSLPEAAATGSVTLTFARAGGETSVVTLLTTASGSHTVGFRTADLALGGPLTAGPAALSPGDYTLSISYGDALGNPSSQVSSSFVIAKGSGSGGDAGSGPATTDTGRAGGGPAHLSLRWQVGKPTHGHARTLSATFSPVAGARAYQLSITNGRRSRLVKCLLTGARRQRQVRCLAPVPSKGSWAATATALGAGGVLAEASAVLHFRS
jgi:hypothetical protein